MTTINVKEISINIGMVLTGPTMSDTWLTVVPEAAPKYKTFVPGFMLRLSIPPRIAAPIFDLKGFHTRYSVLDSFSFKNHNSKFVC